MVGPLWAGLVESSAGWATMCWTLGLLSAFSAVPAGVFTGGLLWKRGQRCNATDTEIASNIGNGDTVTVLKKEKPNIHTSG